MLIKLLEKRFGVLDDELRKLVEDVHIDSVEKAALMILDSRSAEDTKRF